MVLVNMWVCMCVWGGAGTCTLNVAPQSAHEVTQEQPYAVNFKINQQ